MAASSKTTPKLVVFDLDYTLWELHVECCYPTLKKCGSDMCDSSGTRLHYFPEVPEVLDRLKSEGIEIAAASRTEWPKGAEKLINHFGWDKYFTYKEIYPGCKKTHFKEIQKKSGIPYTSMAFFDDENRNIVDVRKLGVTCCLVRDGMNMECLEKTFKSFSEQQS